MPPTARGGRGRRPATPHQAPPRPAARSRSLAAIALRARSLRSRSWAACIPLCVLRPRPAPSAPLSPATCCRACFPPSPPPLPQPARRPARPTHRLPYRVRAGVSVQGRAARSPPLVLPSWRRVVHKGVLTVAKLVAPLFSFSARGQLAKTLVYSGWKGIDDVRSYVVPANPRSAGQQSQRSYFTDGVDLWHDTGLTDDDVTAWNRYSSTLPRPQSGFNAFVSSVIGLRMAGISKANIAMGFDGSIIDSGAGQVDMAITEDGSAVDVIFNWGYSPTSLINVANPVEVANVWTAANVVVISGATVYMRAVLQNVTPVDIGYSGIYRFGPTS